MSVRARASVHGKAIDANNTATHHVAFDKKHDAGQCRPVQTSADQCTNVVLCLYTFPHML